MGHKAHRGLLFLKRTLHDNRRLTDSAGGQRNLGQGRIVPLPVHKVHLLHTDRKQRPTKNNLGRPEGFQTKLQLKKGLHLTVELTCFGLGWRVEEGENEAGRKRERNKKIEKATVWNYPPFPYSLKGNNYRSSWKLLGLELKAKSIAPIWFLFVLPWTAIGWPAEGF